jgi:hypothetical protein
MFWFTIVTMKLRLINNVDVAYTTSTSGMMMSYLLFAHKTELAGGGALPRS